MKRIGLSPAVLVTFALLALLVFVSGGCGSSGNPVITSPIMFNYVPTTGPSPSVTTALGAASTGNVAEIEIHVTDVLDVLGAGFTIDFDPTTVSFVDFDVAGSHLSSDGATIQPFAQLTGTGQITVGVTRLGASGIDFNGRQLLIVIRFRRVTPNGTSMVMFGNNDLLDSMAPPQPIPGVQWFGGEFQVN